MIIRIQILCAAADAALLWASERRPPLCCAPIAGAGAHRRAGCKWLRVGAPVVDAGVLGVARAADESAATAARASVRLRCAAPCCAALHSKALGEWGGTELRGGRWVDGRVRSCVCACTGACVFAALCGEGREGHVLLVALLERRHVDIVLVDERVADRRLPTGTTAAAKRTAVSE